MKQKNPHKPSEAVLLNEIELLLAEKRTYYSILRTGFAIITVPLTIIIFLLATKDYHRLFNHTWTTLIIILVFIIMIITGIFMAIGASNKIKRLNIVIQGIEKEDKRVEKIVV